LYQKLLYKDVMIKQNNMCSEVVYNLNNNKKLSNFEIINKVNNNVNSFIDYNCVELMLKIKKND